MHKMIPHTPAPDALPRSLVLLLVAGAGFGVASIYYSQPILSLLAADMRASDRVIAGIPTVTQLGYALEILFLSPLGDKYDRRTIILAKAVILALAFALCGLANGIGFLLVASLLVGICATLAQDIVPAAAHLAPASSRGKVVGTVNDGGFCWVYCFRVLPVALLQSTAVGARSMPRLPLPWCFLRYWRGSVCHTSKLQRSSPTDRY